MNQLAFCDTIMEQNKRTMLPVEGTLDKFTPLTNINPLDSFFPFDPYVLSRYVMFSIDRSDELTHNSKWIGVSSLSHHLSLVYHHKL